MLRRLSRVLALAGCWLLGSLLLLEVALRVLATLPWSTPTLMADENLGFRAKPSTQLGEIRTNDRGFNDLDWPATPAPGRERWAVVGDSFVFSPLPRAQNLVEQLKPHMPADVDLLNLGILAAGPENYLGILEHEVAALGVRRVLLLFFVGNDIHQAHPDFQTRIFFGAPRALLRSPWRLRLSADYLYVLKMGRGAWRAFGERAAPGSDGGGTFSPSAFHALEAQRLEICRRVADERTAASYLGTAQFFAQVRAWSERSGVELLVALAPDQFQVDIALEQELFADGARRRADFDLALPQRTLLAQLGEAGLPMVDLLPLFRRVGRNQVLYLPRDTHWNADGNRLAARALGQAWAPGDRLAR